MKNKIYVIKSNLMQYLSLVYFVSQPLHVSGIFVAHHQEVYCIYLQQLVRVVLFSYFVQLPPSNVVKWPHWREVAAQKI